MRPALIVIFLLVQPTRGYMPAVKRQIIDLAMNGSEIARHTRILCIEHRYRHRGTEKKERQLEVVNKPLLEQPPTDTIEVIDSPGAEPQRLTKCRLKSARRKHRGGCGTLSITRRVRFWRTY